VADATAETLASWPALAAPMVDALADGAASVPADVADKLAADLAARMFAVAVASAAYESRVAAGQGVKNAHGKPDRDRIGKLAGTFTALLVSGYESAAAQAALAAPLVEGPRLRAAADVIRSALQALGTALTGLVPTQVGAAMAAAEHEGRRAVAEAHPPLFLVADEHDDHAACTPCKANNNKRYDTLDDALEEYPSVGFRSCLGGVRCRGRLRSVWREPLTEPAPSTLAEAAVTHTGAMIALLPSAEDAARLAVIGGEPAEELHCTIAYLGEADRLDAAARQQLAADTAAAVQGMPVVDADAFGLASFGQAGDEPCNVLTVGGDMLDAAHHYLTAFIGFEAPDQHAPWHAHVTLEFTDDLGRLKQYVDRLGPIRFDRVRLAVGGDIIDIPLLGDTADDEDDGYAAWLADQGFSEADVHPGDGRLKRFWLGKGLDKWATSPHPWTALYRHLRKYITNPVLLKKTVSRWYIDHFHHAPNQRRSEALTERYNPGQVRDPGGEHGGQWVAAPGAPGMSWAEVVDMYGPAHDEAEAGDFTVAVFERGDFTLFHKAGGDHFDAVRELDSDYAGELAGRLDEFADDAETADAGDRDHGGDLVDYVHIGGSDALVGRTGDGTVVFSASKSGDREPDLHVIGNPAADQFHLEPGDARDLAGALRNMAERFDDLTEDGALVEGHRPARRPWQPPRNRRQRRTVRAAALAEMQTGTPVLLVEVGALLADPDDGTGDGPLSGEELALLVALDELDAADLAEVYDPSQARYPKGTPLGGKFRPMADRIKQSIADHRAGKHGDKHPLDGYSREQLRKVAKARGIELRRGEDRDSIAAKLLDDHKPAKGNKRPANKPAPAVKPVADKPVAAAAEPNQFAAPFHRNLDGIEDLAAAVDDGYPPKETRPLTGGKSAETELVTLKDGTQVVHKSGGNPDAEQAAAMVAQAIGAPAPRVYRDSAGSVYMDYVDDAVVPDIARARHAGSAKEWREKVEGFASSPAGRLIGLLDLMTVNGDRNDGNWLVKDDGSVVGIDHGHAFMVGIGNGGRRIRPFLLKNMFTAQLVDAGGQRLVSNTFDPADLAAMRARLEARRPDFDHIGRGRWLDYSLAVLDAVAGQARAGAQPEAVAA
jgi:2'-5' RNA ligase